MGLSTELSVTNILSSLHMGLWFSPLVDLLSSFLAFHMRKERRVYLTIFDI